MTGSVARLADDDTERGSEGQRGQNRTTPAALAGVVENQLEALLLRFAAAHPAAEEQRAGGHGEQGGRLGNGGERNSPKNGIGGCSGQQGPGSESSTGCSQHVTHSDKPIRACLCRGPVNRNR